MLIYSNTMISYGERHVEVKSRANIHSSERQRHLHFPCHLKDAFLETLSPVRGHLLSLCISPSLSFLWGIRTVLITEKPTRSRTAALSASISPVIDEEPSPRSRQTSKLGSEVFVNEFPQSDTVKRNKSSLKMRGQVLLWNIDGLTFALYGLWFHSVFCSSLDAGRWIHHTSSFLLLALSVERLIFILIFINYSWSLEGTVHPKWKLCHHLFTLMSFITFSKGDIYCGYIFIL